MYLDLQDVVTPTSSQTNSTPRESISSSVFESSENINIWSTNTNENHRNNQGYLYSARNDSVGSTKDKQLHLTTDDQRDSGLGLETTISNGISNPEESEKTVFREPLVSEV